MRYVQPAITSVQMASTAVHQQQFTNEQVQKLPGSYLDLSAYACTIGAYEADE